MSLTLSFPIRSALRRALELRERAGKALARSKRLNKRRLRRAAASAVVQETEITTAAGSGDGGGERSDPRYGLSRAANGAADGGFALAWRDGGQGRVAAGTLSPRESMREACAPAREGGTTTVPRWVSDDGELHSAGLSLGRGGMLRAAVENLGETGWDWHVWDSAGRVQQRYGLGDTLGEAKQKAASALAELAGQLDRMAERHRNLTIVPPRGGALPSTATSSPDAATICCLLRRKR